VGSSDLVYSKKLTVTLCELTHDLCVWYVYVGLGIFPWTCIKEVLNQQLKCKL
jgi:hypothetical protein